MMPRHSMTLSRHQNKLLQTPATLEALEVPLQYSLQCSLVHGSGRLFPTPLTELDRRARGTRPQDSQDKQNNKRIQGQANLQKIREGREEVTVAGVCVCVMMGPAALCNP